MDSCICVNSKRRTARSRVGDMFKFHFVTLKSDRPRFEFLCFANYFLGLRQFTFLLCSCRMGILYTVSQGSVKKTDDILTT